MISLKTDLRSCNVSNGHGKVPFPSRTVTDRSRWRLAGTKVERFVDVSALFARRFRPVA